MTAKLLNLAQISFRDQLPKIGKGNQHSMGGENKAFHVCTPSGLKFLSKVVMALVTLAWESLVWPAELPTGARKVQDCSRSLCSLGGRDVAETHPELCLLRRLNQ